MKWNRRKMDGASGARRMVTMSPEERRAIRITEKVSRMGKGEKRWGEEKQCIKAKNEKVK